MSSTARQSSASRSTHRWRCNRRGMRYARRSPPRRSAPSLPPGRARRRAIAATARRVGAAPCGSWLIGKNVPENKNSGSTPSRMISGNVKSESSPNRIRGQHCAEGGSTEPGGRDREDPPRRRDRAEQRGDEQERGRAEHRSQRGPQHEARRTAVPDRSGSRPRRGTAASTSPRRAPATSTSDAAELHRARHQESRRDELEIREAVDEPLCALHEAAEADAHRAEVQRGLHERGEREPAPAAARTRALRARRRGTSAESTRRASVLERAAGEDQEHVFEARPPYEHRAGVEPLERDRGRRRVAVVGVDRARDRRGLRCGRRSASGGPPPTARRHRSARRTSTTSRVTLSAIRRRGEPSATMRALSMMTSRSHSCSASSM